MKGWFSVLLLLLVLGCAPIDDDATPTVKTKTEPGPAELTKVLPPTTVELFARDGTRLAGVHYPSGELARPVLLVHDEGEDAHSLDDFAKSIQTKGYQVLSIDLRGHGGSDGDTELFTTEDYQKMTLDVDTGIAWLAERSPRKVMILGAGLGANAALVDAGSNPEVEGVVALSPSKDYRGVDPTIAAADVKVPILFIVGTDDAQSFADVQDLAALYAGDVIIKEVGSSARGFALLEDEPALFASLNFIARNS